MPCRVPAVDERPIQAGGCSQLDGANRFGCRFVFPTERVQGARKEHQQFDREVALPASQAVRHHPPQRGCRVCAGCPDQVQACARHGDEARHLVVVALECGPRGKPRETLCAGLRFDDATLIDEHADTFGQARGDESRPAPFFTELLGFAKQQDGERRLPPCRCDPGRDDVRVEGALDAALRAAEEQPVADEAICGVDLVLLVENARAERRREPGTREVRPVEPRRERQSFTGQPPRAHQTQLLGFHGSLHRQVQDAPQRFAAPAGDMADRAGKLAELVEAPRLPVAETKEERRRRVCCGDLMCLQRALDHADGSIGVVIQRQ